MQDPTRDEMLAHLNSVVNESEEYDEIDFEQAIYWFAADYHGGQTSNLYEALSQSPYKPGMLESGCATGTPAANLFYLLVDEFGG